MPNKYNVQAIQFSPDGARLAIGTANGSFTMWDTKSGYQTYQQQFPGVIASIAFSHDQLIAVAVNPSESNPTVQQQICATHGCVSYGGTGGETSSVE